MKNVIKRMKFVMRVIKFHKRGESMLEIARLVRPEMNVHGFDAAHLCSVLEMVLRFYWNEISTSCQKFPITFNYISTHSSGTCKFRVVCCTMKQKPRCMYHPLYGSIAPYIIPSNKGWTQTINIAMCEHTAELFSWNCAQSLNSRCSHIKGLEDHIASK